jgi:hypothetical protein
MKLSDLGPVLAVNRCAFGLGYLVAPARTGRGWVDRSAADPGTQVMIRGLGVRDLGLGLGALAALQKGDQAAKPWFAAHAAADTADLVATLAAGRALPARRIVFASLMAGASAAIAWAAATDS